MLFVSDTEAKVKSIKLLVITGRIPEDLGHSVELLEERDRKWRAGVFQKRRNASAASEPSQANHSDFGLPTCIVAPEPIIVLQTRQGATVICGGNEVVCRRDALNSNGTNTVAFTKAFRMTNW